MSSLALVFSIDPPSHFVSISTTNLKLNERRVKMAFDGHIQSAEDFYTKEY